MKRWRRVLAVAAAAVAAAGVLVTQQAWGDNGAVAGTVPLSGAITSDWPTWQKDNNGSRYNGLETQITPQTVGNLKLKWAYTYPAMPGAREGSQPAVVGDTMYVGSPDAKFLALDSKTGATKWTFDLAPIAGNPTSAAYNIVRDGAAVQGDMVFFGDSTARVYALNRYTGALLWSQKIDNHPKAWITGSPLLYHGQMIIGVSSTESATKDPNYPCCTHRGSVVALDVTTGAVNWTHYTMPAPQKVGTWPSGVDEFAPSGGMVWGSPIVDEHSNTVFIGTGNGHTPGPGEIDSLLALDPYTGSPKWTHQFNAPDVMTQFCAEANPGVYCPGKYDGTALNYDVGATANLFSINGKTVVGVGQKGGMYHTLDAATGNLVWETRIATPDLSKEDPGSVGTPWGSSFDGKNVYVSTWRSNPGALHALDAATGKIVWETPLPADACTTGGAAAYPNLCEPSMDPAASSSPGLVYAGAADGKMRIYSATDGKILWTFDAVQNIQGVNGPIGSGMAISGNGGAVIVDGMMYVQAGYYPFYPTGKGTELLAFSINGS